MIEREALKTKTVPELRKMMNSGEYTLGELAWIVTEYKLRIPYCEVCGEKANVFARKSRGIVCVNCYRLLYDDTRMENQEFETI